MERVVGPGTHQLIHCCAQPGVAVPGPCKSLDRGCRIGTSVEGGSYKRKTPFSAKEELPRTIGISLGPKGTLGMSPHLALLGMNCLVCQLVRKKAFQ